MKNPLFNFFITKKNCSDLAPIKFFIFCLSISNFSVSAASFGTRTLNAVGLTHLIKLQVLARWIWCLKNRFGYRSKWQYSVMRKLLVYSRFSFHLAIYCMLRIHSYKVSRIVKCQVGYESRFPKPSHIYAYPTTWAASRHRPSTIHRQTWKHHEENTATMFHSRVQRRWQYFWRLPRAPQSSC